MSVVFSKELKINAAASKITLACAEKKCGNFESFGTVGHYRVSSEDVIAITFAGDDNIFGNADDVIWYDGYVYERIKVSTTQLFLDQMRGNPVASTLIVVILIYIAIESCMKLLRKKPSGAR